MESRTREARSVWHWKFMSNTTLESNKLKIGKLHSRIMKMLILERFPFQVRLNMLVCTMTWERGNWAGCNSSMHLWSTRKKGTKNFSSQNNILGIIEIKCQATGSNLQVPIHKSNNYCELYRFRILQLPKQKPRNLLQKLTHTSTSWLFIPITCVIPSTCKFLEVG